MLKIMNAIKSKKGMGISIIKVNNTTSQGEGLAPFERDGDAGWKIRLRPAPKGDQPGHGLKIPFFMTNQSRQAACTV